MSNSMPYLEVKLTLEELRAVVKSLSIGADQLAKKTYRMGDDPRASDIAKEYVLLANAKAEFEEVLIEAMKDA